MRENNDSFCCCGIHVHSGAFCFLLLILLVGIGGAVKGIMDEDDFLTVGSLLDCGVVFVALLGNRLRSRGLYQPFFGVHLILSFFVAVITVLLFIRIYEKSEKWRTAPKDQLLFYILILLFHSYALKVVFRSYQYLGAEKRIARTEVDALRKLVELERQKMRTGNIFCTNP